MGFLEVSPEATHAVDSSLFRAKKRLATASNLSMVRAMRDAITEDPRKLHAVVGALLETAADPKHPQQVAASRIILDRLDGPVKQQVQLAWDKATEGITLHLPTPKAIEEPK